MRQFIVGFLLGCSAFSVARAIDVSVSNPNVRDFYAMSALSGLIANGNNMSNDSRAKWSFDMADAMLLRRGH